jgi:hypothetical protein
MANRGGNRNKLVVPGSENLLNQMKLEIAQELGIANYDQIDKGALPARVHGAIGGTMTKRLIELGQQALANEANLSFNDSNLDLNQYQQDMVQDLQSAANPSANAAQVQLQ